MDSMVLKFPSIREEFRNGYPFFMPKEEFINCYKKSAIKLGGSRLKFAEVGIMPDKIIFALAY